MFIKETLLKLTLLKMVFPTLKVAEVMVICTHGV